MTTPAIIVGCDGQDGRILFERLTEMGRAVVGIDRNIVRSTVPHTFDQVDILDSQQVTALVRNSQPTEIYYLPAFHYSSEDRVSLCDRDVFEAGFSVHVMGLLNFLQAMRSDYPRARLFYAASSHVFGEAKGPRQDERTALNPVCPYGTTKTAGIHACRYFRRERSLFASVGILYNHESPLRSPGYVSQKIVRAAVRIQHGLQDKLVLGDLSVQADWGWAPDYVEAMIRILQLPGPDDFVIATGEPHTVQQFVEEAFGQLGLDWRCHVEVDSSIITRRRIGLLGDASKLRQATSWRPSVSFSEMVRRLLGSAEDAILQERRTIQ